VKVSRPATGERPACHTRRLLFESLGISVVDFRCGAEVEAAGPEEPNQTHSIVLVRKGTFLRTQQRQTILADANHVLFFNAAEPYRYAHPLPGGDACTILTVETQRALALVARCAPSDAQRPERPFRLGHALSSPRAARLHWELLELVDRSATRLALDEVLTELADEAIRCAYRLQAEPVADERPTSGARRRGRDMAEAVKLALSERLDSPPSLSELARMVDCSPFHLSRVFHSATGLSLRSYVGRLRARLAAERLAVGARDLTRLALDLGYADHSHFTNSFRREWGVPPSRFRASRSAATGRATNVEAKAPPID
jgi:AraC-like DNA-binding protein